MNDMNDDGSARDLNPQPLQSLHIDELCILLGMSKSCTTPYHSEGNQVTKLSIATFISKLGQQKIIMLDRIDWTNALLSATF